MMTLTTFLLIVVIVGLVFFLFRKLGSGSAGDDNRHCLIRKKKATEKDPVCGMTVEHSSLSHKYQARVYYFCSEHCQQVFAESPGDFV